GRLEGWDPLFAGGLPAGLVDADDLVPDFLAELVDPAVVGRREDARIGDENVEPAIGLDDLFERRVDLRLLADVDNDGCRLAARRRDLFQRVIGGRFLPLEDRDRTAFLGEPFGRRLTDA